MGPEGTKADYEIMRRALGFDRPLPEQYGHFLARAVQGDFGRSLRHRQPTLPLVLERFPATARSRSPPSRWPRSSRCRSASWPPCGGAPSWTPAR